MTVWKKAIGSVDPPSGGGRASPSAKSIPVQRNGREVPAGSDGTGSSGPSSTVLVIDDSEIARTQMVRVLRAAGIATVDIPSPIGATRAVMAHNVGVVVVDVLMPGMRGDRLAALFRGNARLQHLAVVLVSGESSVELERLREESGADAVVSKAHLEDLAAAVRRARQRRAGNGG